MKKNILISSMNNFNLFKAIPSNRQLWPFVIFTCQVLYKQILIIINGRMFSRILPIPEHFISRQNNCQNWFKYPFTQSSMFTNVCLCVYLGFKHHFQRNLHTFYLKEDVRAQTEKPFFTTWYHISYPSTPLCKLLISTLLLPVYMTPPPRLSLSYLSIYALLLPVNNKLILPLLPNFFHSCHC